MSAIPYPGLRPFEREEAYIFFGREEQTDKLLKKLSDSRFISVIGVSGCGKSSLVRAGMIAALENGYLAETGPHWRVAKMQPGDHPMHNLAKALLEGSVLDLGQDQPENLPRKTRADVEKLSRFIVSHGPMGLMEVFRENPLPKDTNVLLLVDQFEEIFRYHRQGDRDEAEAFVALLLTSAEQREVPVYVVTTMRSDFIGECALFRGLPEVVSAGQFLAPRLTQEQLRMAIIGPAGVVGGVVEPRLVNRLLNEMGTDPDQLPVLQHCLMRMWFRARSRTGVTEEEMELAISGSPTTSGVTMTLKDYEAVGGIEEALSKHADEAFNTLDKKQQNIAEHLFRCLSERIPGKPDTRRPVKVNEAARVAGVSESEVIEVVEVFRHPDRCFLTPAVGKDLESDTVLDISHESLIRQWQRMNKWVNQEVSSANTYQHLRETAHLWKQGQAALWGTPDLENALAWKRREKPTAKWAKRYGGDFELAMEFLKESENHQKEQRQREEHERRREFVLKIVVIAAIGLIIALTAVAYLWQKATNAKAEAERQAHLIRSGSLTVHAQNALKINPQRSLLLAVEALKVTLEADEPRVSLSEEALRQALQQTGVYGLSHDGPTWNVTFTSDSRWLITGSMDGTVRLWDLYAADVDRNPLILREQKQPIYNMAVSQNDSWLVTSSMDGTVRLWDLRTVKDSKVTPIVLRKHERQVSRIAISPDNHWLITGDETTTMLWDLPLQDPEAAPIILSEQRSLSPWLSEIEDVSPDSRWLVTCQRDGAVKLLDLTTADPTAAPRVLRGHEDEIRIAAFSDDSRWLVTGSLSPDARLWDLHATEPMAAPQLLPDHKNGVKTVAFSHDNRWLVTVSQDGTVRLWNFQATDPGANSQVLPKQTGDVSTIAISPDSHWLVTGSQNGPVQLWDLTAEDPASHPIVLQGYGGSVYRINISSDSRWLIIQSWEGLLRWDLTAPDPSMTLIDFPKQEELIFRVAISPNSRWMAAGGQGNTVWLWDLSKKLVVSPIILRGHRAAVSAAAFSLDNQRLITTSKDRTAQFWDLQTEEPLSTPIELSRHGDEITAVALSADGRWLVTGSKDRVTQLWDLQAKEPMPTSLSLVEYEDEITAVALSADGRWLAFGSKDHTVWLWDLQTEDPSASPIVLRGHEGAISAVAFSADNRWLATGSEDHTARLWDLQTEDPSVSPIVLRGHEGAISAVAFSPDNRWLATGSEDYTARLWDLQTEDPSAPPIVLRGHEGAISAIAFSADTRWLVTGSRDRTARLWDLRTENPTVFPVGGPVVLKGHQKPVTTVAISSDNHWVVTGSEDGTVRLWTLQLEELIDLACQAVGRNLYYDEWKQYFPGEKYRQTCPDLPVHSSVPEDER